MSDDDSEGYRAYIWARAEVDVEASSGEEAIKKAYAQADLGDLEAVPGEALHDHHTNLQEVDDAE